MLPPGQHAASADDNQFSSPLLFNCQSLLPPLITATWALPVMAIGWHLHDREKLVFFLTPISIICQEVGLKLTHTDACFPDFSPTNNHQHFGRAFLFLRTCSHSVFRKAESHGQMPCGIGLILLLLKVRLRNTESLRDHRDPDPES